MRPAEVSASKSGAVSPKRRAILSMLSGLVVDEKVREKAWCFLAIRCEDRRQSFGTSAYIQSPAWHPGDRPMSPPGLGKYPSRAVQRGLPQQEQWRRLTLDHVMPSALSGYPNPAMHGDFWTYVFGKMASDHAWQARFVQDGAIGWVEVGNQKRVPAISVRSR